MQPDRKQSDAAGDDMATVLLSVPDNDKAWWRRPYLLKLNLLLFSVMLFSSATGYDNSMMNGLQSLEQWQDFMEHPTGAYLGLINGVQAMAAIFGYPIMAQVANIYGRKLSIYVGVAILALGVGLQTGAQSPGMFIGARAVVGFASGFLGASPLLIAETAFPTHRGKITAGYNTLYYIGSLIAAWATFGTRNYSNSWAWRVPSVLQFLIPAVCFTGFVLCPESPRWLISKGRHEEARAILIKYHAGGDADSPLVTFEMTEIQQALEMEVANIKTTSYLDMLKTKGNRHRLFITISLGVFAQWNGVGVVSYYLSAVLTTVGITDVTQQTLINGFLQVWNLIFAVGAASFVDRLGRRRLFIASAIGMLVSYTIITGLSGSFAYSGAAGTGTAVIPMLFIYYAFYDIAFTPLLVAYPTEIWSYQLRSRGIAVLFASTFIALFFNLFVNPIALGAITWKYYIVYIIILIIICLTVFFLYPETKGRTLEEIAVVFDGDNAEVPAQGVVLGAVSDKLAEEGVQKEYANGTKTESNM